MRNEGGDKSLVTECAVPCACDSGQCHLAEEIIPLSTVPMPKTVMSIGQEVANDMN